MDATTITLVISAASAIYSLLIYLLPPETAKKLKPVGVILKALASTPGGLKANTLSTIDVYQYYDDIYINNSWARVEIGDDPDYDSCTHREMQIPTAWSSDSVDITVNQGSFPDGATAYLFVVDEDGIVNTTGKSITFGGQPTLPGAGKFGAGNSLRIHAGNQIIIGAN